MVILINQDIGLCKRKSGNIRVKLVLGALPPSDLRVPSPLRAYMSIPEQRL